MEPTYRFLNREGRWLDMHQAGLWPDADGALRLEPLPALSGPMPPETGAAPPEQPAGIAVTPEGDVFLTDPGGHRLVVIRGCDPARGTTCLREQLHTPSGLLYHPERRALLLADTGNRRVLILGLPGLELTEVWDGFAAPTSLAYGPAGDVYIVDDGAVLKFDLRGRQQPWGTVPATEVATGVFEDASAVFVLDARTGLIHIRGTGGASLAQWDTGLARPVGIVTHGATLYAGDNAGRQLIVLRDGHRSGQAHGYARPVAAITVDRRRDELLVHTGSAELPVRLAVRGAFRDRGILWGGPFRNPSSRRDPMHLLRAQIEATRPGTHFRLHVCSDAPVVDPDSADPFSDPCWRQRPIAPDASQTLVEGAPLDDMWVGILLTGDGSASPVLSQIRVDFDHTTYLRRLPVLYQRDATSRDLLARWLTLFESLFDQAHRRIEALPALFDPDATPGTALDWLASWVGVTLPADEAARRSTIADALASHARRGTPAGLRSALRMYAGIEAVIEEPITHAECWRLPGQTPADEDPRPSGLGFSTMLASGDPQGAVVGATTTLGETFLTPTPLFADVAHRFTLRLYQGGRFSADTVAAARAVVEREMPAHTAYHVCVIEPKMRVGVQARLGLDAIIGGPPSPTVLANDAAPGLVLGGEPPLALGTGTVIGGSTTNSRGGTDVRT